MILDFLKENTIFFKKAAAIEIIVGENDEVSIAMVIGELKNNKVNKLSESFVIDSIEKLAEKIGTAIPVSVIINGKLVLVKEHIMDRGDSNSNPTLTAFPEIDHSKFYSSLFKNEHVTTISIARKEVIDDILSKLIKLNLQVYNVSIGISAVQHVFPYIDAKTTGDIETNWCKLSLDSTKAITQIEQKATVDKSWSGKHEYLVGNQYIHPFTLLAFGALIELLAKNIYLTESISSDILSFKRNEFKWKRYFHIAGISILAFTFAILLVNYLVYSTLYSKNQELQSKLPFIAGKKTQNQPENKEYEAVVEYITTHNWDKKTKISFFTDRIASLLPNELLLTSIEVYPETKGASSFSQTLNFSGDKILVKGISPDPSYVNAFMNNLETLQGLKTVKLKKYFTNKEKQINEFNLELQIK